MIRQIPLPDELARALTFILEADALMVVVLRDDGTFQMDAWGRDGSNPATGDFGKELADRVSDIVHARYISLGGKP